MNELEKLYTIRIPQPPINTKPIPHYGFWGVLSLDKWSQFTEVDGSFCWEVGIGQEILCSGSSPVENRARREWERAKEQVALRIIRQRG